MRRFFVPPETLSDTEVPLSGEVLHHLATVLRLKIGDQVLLLDGLGTLCRCRIEALGKRSGAARVLKRWQEQERALPIQLLQALPKGDKMDLVLQKGTELGVTAFTPLLAERTVPNLAGKREDKRQQRWDRIIREAARQSRRPCLPRLDSPQPLAAALAACNARLRLMLWEEESRPLAGVLPPDRPADIAVLIGPEGGFSPVEAQQARTAGFLPVSLGPRILRSETAGLPVASILQYLYGDLGSAPGQAPSTAAP